MKYLAYTLSMIFLLTLNLKGQDASGDPNPVELTKKEKRELKKETKKKEKELKKEQKKSKKNKAIKIGELPPEDQEDQTNSIKIDVNLGNASLENNVGKVKIQKGMSFSYGLISLLDISSGDIEFSAEGWTQNRQGTFFASSTQTWDIFYNQYRLVNSPFWLRTGASMSWSVLDFGKNNYISTDFLPGPEKGVSIITDTSIDRSKSSLTTSYIEIPLELVFNSSNDGNKGLTIGIGGYLGRRLQTTRKMNYDDMSGPIQDRRINRFYNNPWSYGLYARLGYSRIYVKGSFALSNYFQQAEDIQSPNYQLARLTLGIDLL